MDSADEFAQRWLQSADGDIQVLVVGLEHEAITNAVFGFHTQQATEKLLKGLLAARGEDPPRIHDVNELAEQASRLYGVRLGHFVDPALTTYAVAERYPGMAIVPSPPLNREAALQQVRTLRQTTLQLQKGLRPPEHTVA